DPPVYPSTGTPCFFFQAEDGIRGFHVTGVQTCALPISRVARTAPPPIHPRDRRRARPLPGRPVSGTPWSSRSGRARARPPDRCQIGRASCREGGEGSVGAGALKRETRRRDEREQVLVPA